MKNKKVFFKSVLLFLFTAIVMLSVSSCIVQQRPNYRSRHDNGLHRGWYKNRTKGSHGYKSHQKASRGKKIRFT